MAYSPIPSVPSQRLWGGINGQAGTPSSHVPGLDWQMDSDSTVPIQPNVEAGSEGLQSAAALQTLPGCGFPLLRLIGQIGATYLVAEGPDGLYLIDQHAAHERILYEKLLLQRSNEIVMQPLLQPVTLQLAPHQAALLSDSLETINQLGFVVEEFGDNTFRVRAIPGLLSSADPETILRGVVEDIEEDESPLQSEMEARIASRVCKRAAVKGGMTLAPEEQMKLLRDLEQCQSPRTCPHGRPTMIHLSVDVLERQFGRRGSR